MATYNGDGTPNIFTGGDDPDTATGNGGDDTLNGNDGNDILAGNAGADTLSGGAGEDTIFTADRDFGFGYPFDFSAPTGPGVDTGSEADTVSGGADTDYIFAGWNDNIDGGTGNDFLYLSVLAATSGVTMDFNQATQTNGSGTIQSMEAVGWLQGSNHDDVFILGPQVNYAPFTYVYAMGGNDSVTAGYTTWAIYGGDGNDTLDARPSQYLGVLDGGAGDDTLYTRRYVHETYGGDGNDTIYGGGSISGGAGDDEIFLLENYDSGGVFGDEGNDVIHAGPRLGGFVISGGAGADTLLGDLGNDTLVSSDFAAEGYYIPLDDAGLEKDILTGGDGNDLLVVGLGDDADGGSGIDTLRLSLLGSQSGLTFDSTGINGSFTFGGGTIQNIENFEYLRGTEFDDDLTIGTQTTLVSVDAGAGNDIVRSNNSSVEAWGGAGNDRFVSGLAGDSFDGGEGTDTIDYSLYIAGVSVALAETGEAGIGGGGDMLLNIENAVGSIHDDVIVGNSLVNFFEGGAGADTLSGAGGNDILDGGTGVDLLSGGTGDDTYHVDQQSDLVVENPGEGNDTVLSTANFYLYANIENLTLADGAGDLFGVGNAIANTITGNAGGNLIIGGDGNDTLYGVDGVDSLFGEAGNDTIAGGADNDYLVGGTGDDHLNGGEGGDAIYGEDGDDLLIGGSDFVTDILVGGAGDDTLYANSGLNDYDLIDGGAGNDYYYVDTGDDLTFEAEDGGTDTVYANVSNVPNAGVYLYANVENLVLLGTTAFGVGNELNNSLSGSASANWLLGGAGDDGINGGAGNDVLFGEAGSDTFVFGTGSGADVIGDFVHGEDRINLSAYEFASFTELSNSFHQVGSDGAIDLGDGNIVVLLGVTMSTLDAGDFVL